MTYPPNSHAFVNVPKLVRSQSAAEHNARTELKARIQALIAKYYEQNLYAQVVRDRISKDVAKVRDAVMDRHPQVSVPIVALYVGDMGSILKAQFQAPTLLKGEGCVGWMVEKKAGVTDLQITKSERSH